MIKLGLIFLLVIPSFLCSQGFDWQVSSREPYEITELYVGAVGSFSLNTHTGEFPFLENDVQCCNYGNGSGTTVQFGISSEYWFQPLTALSAGVLYSNVGAILRRETTVMKKINPDLPAFSWTTAYESVISLNYVTFDIAIKRRIFEKLSIKAGIDLNFFLTSEQIHKNVIVEPSNIPFSDGSFEKELENGQIGKLSPFVLGVMLGLSYDINLGLERYGELNFNTNYSINSYIADNSWHNFQTRIVARVYLGIR